MLRELTETLTGRDNPSALRIKNAPLLIRACLIAFLLTRTVKTSLLPGRTVPADGVTVKNENSSFCVLYPIVFLLEIHLV